MAIVRRNQTKGPVGERRARPRDREELVAELDAGDPAARLRAAKDLAAISDADGALVGRLPLEPDPAVREAILTSLTLIGSAVAVEGLVRCLRSEDAALRNEAIEALKQLPERVGPIMAGLLADPDADVRIFAVDILESLRHPDVEAWLLDVVRRDAHVNVCATAVDLLGEVGTEACLGPLAALKERFPEEPFIAFSVDAALRRVRGG